MTHISRQLTRDKFIRDSHCEAMQTASGLCSGMLNSLPHGSNFSFKLHIALKFA